MPDTARVDITYRPLRFGWAVRAGDAAAMRQVFRHSHALWGGRYNPILVVDQEEDARHLVELFRLDFILPVGDSPEVKAFVDSFPHLIKPFHTDSVFVKQEQWRCFSWLLDVHNAVSHWHRKPEWKQLKDLGIRDYHWLPEDPLADAFLAQLGEYPSPADVGTNYAEIVARSLEPTIYRLTAGAPIPSDVVEVPSRSVIGRIGISRHYSVQPGWDAPGFFVGDASDPADLIAFWNLRACDIHLWFIDPTQIARYEGLIPAWTEVLRGDLAHHRFETDRLIGLWSRGDLAEAQGLFPGTGYMHCQIREHFWSGGSVRPPVMFLGQTTTLGVLGKSDDAPRVDFTLPDKPFSGDPFFAQQHVVASVSLIGGLYGDDSHTFRLPYVPELNEFYARTMALSYDKLRVGPETIDLIVDAADHAESMTAMPVSRLVVRLFKLAGIDASLSDSGRILRQILSQLGGVQGARVFKIPGVRSLLRTFGLADSFSRRQALPVIASRTGARPGESFAPHRGLFLKPRPLDSKLDPPQVFSYMVEAGLFRVGADLVCPRCEMRDWVAIDSLKQRAECGLCGHAYDATGQLVSTEFMFRRSGVLGREKNAQGAVPVALALQQLDTTLRGSFRSGLYSPSLNIQFAADRTGLPCETDFLWIESGRFPERTSIALAECKDAGQIPIESFRNDLENLRRAADGFPAHRFKTYIVLVKLSAFTEEEIVAARALNQGHLRRAILLSARELEPYHITDEWERVLGRRPNAFSLKDLADITAEIYFTPRQAAEA